MSPNLKLIVTKWCEMQHGREMQNKIKVLAIKFLQDTWRYCFPLSNKVLTSKVYNWNKKWWLAVNVFSLFTEKDLILWEFLKLRCMEDFISYEVAGLTRRKPLDKQKFKLTYFLTWKKNCISSSCSLSHKQQQGYQIKLIEKQSKAWKVWIYFSLISQNFLGP